MSFGELSKGYLFSSRPLRDLMSAKAHQMLGEIEGMNRERMEGVESAKLASDLKEKFRIEALRLHLEGIYMEVEETEMDASEDLGISRFFGEGDETVKGQRFTVHVPFTGTAELFQCQPSEFSGHKPVAAVLGQELLLQFDVPNDRHFDLDAHVEQACAEIRKYMAWQEADLRALSVSLETDLNEAIDRRKAELELKNSRVKASSIPLKSPGSSPSGAGLAISRVRDGEAQLAQERYELALNLIQRHGVALRMSPTLAATLSIEALRNFLLLALNAAFEGSSNEEIFQVVGLSAISLRVRGKETFVLELEKGSAASDLENLLKRLLAFDSWPDAKLVVILLCSGTAVSESLWSVESVLKHFSNFRHLLPWNRENGLRALLQHPKDLSRNLTLSLLLWELPS